MPDKIELYGIAAGGNISLTVNDQLISVATSNGQSAQQVLETLALAINSQLPAVTARRLGDLLVTDGSISNSQLLDQGLSFAPIPLAFDEDIPFPGFALVLMVITLLISGGRVETSVLRQRRAER